MQDLQFPLDIQFKITTFSNDFTVRDAQGATVYFVRQKLFKFVEEVVVFSDETQSELLYTIKANQWIDFSAAYVFTHRNGQELGRVGRQGWASLWKAHYQVFNPYQEMEFSIQEENAWVRVGDMLFGQIPVLGIFTGYFFNPSYSVESPDGITWARLQKEKSFFGRRFSVHQERDFGQAEGERIILSLMMMLLLERSRG